MKEVNASELNKKCDDKWPQTLKSESRAFGAETGKKREGKLEKYLEMAHPFVIG